MVYMLLIIKVNGHYEHNWELEKLWHIELSNKIYYNLSANIE